MTTLGLKSFDDVVIGSGQAAPSLAVALAKSGRAVALVEGNRIGGSCVNYGCTPTKTLRKSARIAHEVGTASLYGVTVHSFEVNFEAAMARMRERVEASRAGLETWLSSTPGLTVIRGWASFVRAEAEQFQLAVDETELSARRVFLNTGTRPFIPQVPGLNDVGYLDNVSLLELVDRPDHLIILGGSYIGLEMGQIFRRLGCKVTIVETGPAIASREDDDVSEAIRLFLEEEGITILRSSAVKEAQRTPSGRALRLASGAVVEGSHILVATGRTPNTDRLHLGRVGVSVDDRGYIPTDRLLRTNVSGIWALGDINKRGAFTHTSYHDHEIVLASLSVGKMGPLHQWRDADSRPQTYAMFTDPPLGRVGMSLKDAMAAVKKGRKILVATHPVSQVSRAKEEGETHGLIRLLVDAETERFVGATVLGITGDEIIAVISNFMATGASYRVMQQALPVHPTVAEFLPTILTKLAPVVADGE